MGNMTTAEKIKAIEDAGWRIAWDGCHKIYFLEDDERYADAVATEYDIYPASELRRIISNSCGLVFVSRWGMGSNEDFVHKFNIEQCTEDIYEAAT